MFSESHSMDIPALKKPTRSFASSPSPSDAGMDHWSKASNENRNIEIML
jgi:hypothetical protein